MQSHVSHTVLCAGASNVVCVLWMGTPVRCGVVGAVLTGCRLLGVMLRVMPLRRAADSARFHEQCILGWTIVGKKDTCPFCNEKVTLASVAGTSAWRKQVRTPSRPSPESHTRLERADCGSLQLLSLGAHASRSRGAGCWTWSATC